MFTDGYHNSSAFSGWNTRLRLGLYTYATGSIVAGILDLIWGDFEAAQMAFPPQAKMMDRMSSNNIRGRRQLECNVHFRTGLS